MANPKVPCLLCGSNLSVDVVDWGDEHRPSLLRITCPMHGRRTVKTGDLLDAYAKQGVEE